MAIEWQNIRPFNNSQNNAFEELVCQLAREEPIADKKEFYRIAAPDGGVEAYCVLNNGDEYGWQAKYFQSMETSQWTQLKESFETAFRKHPNLIKYYICIPLDRQDPRLDGKMWFMDKWNEKINEWMDYTKSVGRDIEFEYWGSSELIHRLSQEKHEGRILFWFSKEEFSDEWFRSHIENSIINLGHRYTPELNIELDISKYFDAISRNEAFRENIKGNFHNLFKEINKAIEHLPSLEPLQEKATLITSVLNNLKTQFEITQNQELININIDEIQKNCKTINDSLYKCEEILNDIKGIKSGFSKDSIDYDKHLINKAESAIYEFSNGAHITGLSLAKLPIMWLSGEAGIGKSHLLADIASRRNNKKQPCILLLGQHFTSKESPWTQILNNLLRLKCNEKELLGALNAKAEALGERILFIIDAINEGMGCYFWPDNINGFINEFNKYPWIGLILSIRSSYENLIIPEKLVANNIVLRVIHRGFEDVEYQASKFFFSQYGIEQPSVPLLHPEFSNPLFLKLFCEGLHRSGQSRIPKGYGGISSIMDFFLESVDKKLSQPQFFDYPSYRHMVKKVVDNLIEYKIKNNSNFIPYEVAFDIGESILSKFSNKRRFLDSLISEGVLSKNLYWVKNGLYEEGIYLAYERFEDHLTVSYLLDKYLKEQNPEKEFKDGGNLAQYIDPYYYRQGLLEAFSIQLPERIDKELFELLDDKRKGYDTVIIAFINSLIWRKPDTIKEKVRKYVNQYILPYQHTFDLFFQMVYSVSTDPKHFFNANSLHRYSMKFSMADRDSIWTTYLHDKNYEGSAMQRLIDWAWLEEDKSYLSNESRLLACKALAWLFTSTNIKFRDSSTKALVILLENHIPLITQLLLDFQCVNDPYIYERIFAAAYGTVLRSDELDGLADLSQYILKNIFQKDEVYTNVLVRDYARNIIEYAIYKNLIQLKNPEIIRPPYKSSFPEKFPTNEDIDAYRYDYNSKDFKDHFCGRNSIISSMTTEYGRGIGGYGDFGRYTFESRLRLWDKFKAQDLSNYACKLIFEKYGYDVEKHGRFDRYAHSGDRYRNKTERIGKKYQWIALYEILARIADNHQMVDPSTRWGDDQKYIWFQGPWEPFIRNIDPTSIQSLTKKYNQFHKKAWWNKINYNDWDGSHESWMIRKDNLPNAKDIIDISDSKNEEWLVLEKNISWDEPIPVGQDSYKFPHKHLSYNILSYLVREEQFARLISWAKKQHFVVKGWLPNRDDQYEIFCREYYWSPAYRFFDNSYYGRCNWEKIPTDYRNRKTIAEVMSTSEGYRWESGGDYENQPSYLVPREFMYIKMQLQPSKNIGEWLNTKGEIICFDPSTRQGEISCLIIKKNALIEFLKANSLKIFWVCLGEKQIYGDFIHRIEIKRWLELSGVFSLEKNRVAGSMIPIVQQVRKRGTIPKI
jgi:hypothetical protein